MAHIQERYTRVDQYNIQLTVTVNDPKFYTKPWTFMRANLYWMKAQGVCRDALHPVGGARVSRHPGQAVRDQHRPRSRTTTAAPRPQRLEVALSRWTLIDAPVGFDRRIVQPLYSDRRKYARGSALFPR